MRVVATNGLAVVANDVHRDRFRHAGVFEEARCGVAQALFCLALSPASIRRRVAGEPVRRARKFAKKSHDLVSAKVSAFIDVF